MIVSATRLDIHLAANCPLTVTGNLPIDKVPDGCQGRLPDVRRPTNPTESSPRNGITENIRSTLPGNVLRDAYERTKALDYTIKNYRSSEPGKSKLATIE